MGDYSMTCSVSGLSIDGGTAVRCVLLTASPYEDSWIVRTPPIRALYNSYGTIEHVHPDDRAVARLWLRGLREDTIEIGLGDNSVHDVPVSRDMTFEDTLGAVRAGRLRVRQDARTFWRGPSSFRDGEEVLAFPQRVAQALETAMPGSVSSWAETGKYVIDEPVPNLVRVRFGRYEHGEEHTAALGRGLQAVEKAALVGVVAAGSGRYANDADLLVFPQPNPAEHVRGPLWDMATGQGADQDKKLLVSLAMVREDVWQAMVAFPHSDSVQLDCVACGQQACYHERDLRCPRKSINKKPYKEHAADARYSHGPVFPEGVEHVVVPREFGETVWYGIDAFKASIRETWKAILRHFHGPHERAAPDPAFDRIIESMKAAGEKERARVATLPVAEREALEAEAAASRAAWEAEELRKREHPRFGDFHIGHHVLPTEVCSAGSWVLVDSVPGVIGIPDHMSMMLADKADVPEDMLDAIAELSAVRSAMRVVGVTWKPAVSSGPQYAEWPEHVRFHRTMMRIAMSEAEGREDSVPLADTLEEAIAIASRR